MSGVWSKSSLPEAVQPGIYACESTEMKKKVEIIYLKSCSNFPPEDSLSVWVTLEFLHTVRKGETN